MLGKSSTTGTQKNSAKPKNKRGKKVRGRAIKTPTNAQTPPTHTQRTHHDPVPIPRTRNRSRPNRVLHPRWDRAQPISIIAKTKQEATTKALEMLGTHPRFGNHHYYGWAIKWDRIDEEPNPYRSQK